MTDRAQAESGDQLAVLDGDFARAASRRERAVPLWQWGAGVAALIAAGGVGESQQGQLDSSSPDSTEVPGMVRLVNVLMVFVTISSRSIYRATFPSIFDSETST